MASILEISLDSVMPVVRAIAIPVIVFIIFNFLVNIAEKQMLKKARTKKQINNIEIFHKLAKVLLILLIIWVSALSYTGSVAGLGLSLGLFAVIIAWTFMRPLLGVVAWLTLVIKRPFVIGDRIKIGEIKGDVYDITLTHIYINETGGQVHGTEDTTGSLVIIPNAVVFENPIINYTDKDNYVLTEVSFTVTFESDIERAQKIALESAVKVLKKEIPGYNKQPYTRIYMHAKGVGVHVRFHAPARELGEYTSSITYEIIKTLKIQKKVRLCSTELIHGG